jgi:predicted ATPase
MLTQITLKNFKCFKHETVFPLGKITLLTGVNGGGKSSMLQAMLLFRQSIEHNPTSTLLILNGSCVQLGSFDEVRNSENPNDIPIEIGFTNTINETPRKLTLNAKVSFVENDQNPRALQPERLVLQSDQNLFWTTSQGSADNKTEPLKKIVFSFLGVRRWDHRELASNGSLLAETSLLVRDFFPEAAITLEENNSKYSYSQALNLWFPFKYIHYVCADRIGPKNTYTQENIGEFPNTGAMGSGTATILGLLGDTKKVNQKLYLGNDAETLITQTQEWLNYIFDGAKIDIESPYNDMINIFYNTNKKSHRYSGANVGFGYSYILPIIVSGLIANNREILIVENPEAHLHPKAQNRLTKFLAHVASCGVQVFIESHSEHILNALRIVALRDDFEIQNSDVSVLYFQDNDQNSFSSLKIETDGKIKNWPDGFFDQQEQDLAEIFKLGRSKR